MHTIVTAQNNYVTHTVSIHISQYVKKIQDPIATVRTAANHHECFAYHALLYGQCNKCRYTC